MSKNWSFGVWFADTVIGLSIDRSTTCSMSYSAYLMRPCCMSCLPYAFILTAHVCLISAANSSSAIRSTGALTNYCFCMCEYPMKQNFRYGLTRSASFSSETSASNSLRRVRRISLHQDSFRSLNACISMLSVYGSRLISALPTSESLRFSMIHFPALMKQSIRVTGYTFFLCVTSRLSEGDRRLNS